MSKWNLQNKFSKTTEWTLNTIFIKSIWPHIHVFRRSVNLSLINIIDSSVYQPNAMIGARSIATSLLAGDERRYGRSRLNQSRPNPALVPSKRYKTSNSKLGAWKFVGNGEQSSQNWPLPDCCQQLPICNDKFSCQQQSTSTSRWAYEFAIETM